MMHKVTNTEWYANMAQMNRLEEGLNRLLANAGLAQTGQHTV